MKVHRRSWLKQTGLGIAGTAVAGGAQREKPKQPRLALRDFAPRSGLHVPETKVPRARFPVIDCHVHLSSIEGRPMPKSTVPPQEGPGGPKPTTSSDPRQVLALMDRKNVRTLVNVTGGYGPALDYLLNRWHKPYPDRFLVCTEPWWTRTNQPGYAKFQADEVARAHKLGASGVKVLKTLGLYLREGLDTGPLVKVDDRRFDPMWDTAGRLQMPVLIHVSDPECFFDPVDRFNERYLLLLEHPDWSFHGKDFPGNRELQEARNRVVERHPGTEFVALHMGNPENLAWVGEWLDKYPNLWVEFGARMDDTTRQLHVAQKFFDRYQDRILFGTDALMDEPQRVPPAEKQYELYFRCLETDDDYIESENSAWRNYGLSLPEGILRKIYYGNAQRLFRLGA
jgi:predicted TIM-barrel fold metal-dependent hydrolase